MHQPCYVDPIRGTALMPWVRLHATKGYLDMIWLADQYPDFLETVHLIVKGDDESHVYFMCNNLATLMWLGQLAGLELHASYARVVSEPMVVPSARLRSPEPTNKCPPPRIVVPPLSVNVPMVSLWPLRLIVPPAPPSCRQLPAQEPGRLEISRSALVHRQP